MKKAILIFIKIAIFFIGWAVLSGVIDIPSENPAIWRFFAELIPLAVLVVLTAVFCRMEKEKVEIPILTNELKGTLTGTLTGTVAGIFWIGLSAGVLLASRQLILTERQQVSFLWLWILSAFLNVVMQELLVRGYIYQLLKERYSTVCAVIVTTALFTLMHGGAFEAGIVPVLNVVTMCLFTTALYEAEKTLLAPIMAHAVWNIAGAILLGGVSLAEDYPSLYQMTASGSTLLSGGEYKIEASILVTGLNVLWMLFFIYRYKCKKTDQ